VPYEGSEYQVKISPTLAQRWGLGVGNPLFDAITLLVIALAAGLPLTVINAGIVLALLAAWYPLEKLVPHKLAWPAYVGVVTIAFLLIFEAVPFASKLAFVIGGLGNPTAITAVAGGIFTGVWLSWRGMREEEPIYRAAVLVIAGLFIISAAWATGQVETHITMI
jgi:hypothetical protein